MSRPTILFVDDEPMLLAGLQRGLRYMRNEWSMEFASSGPEALQFMERKYFDVIVSDMRMPGMSGAQLLEEVRMRYPQTIRFVLSGQLDSDSLLRTANPAHQYLAKPCAPDELCQKVRAALSLRALLSSARLKEIVSQTRSLPSLPTIYQELLEKIQSDSSSVNDVGAMIERDMAMTSKVLQLVNSAFFGVGSHIASAAQAVQVLGTETIASLVVSLEIFSQFSISPLWKKQVDWLWGHSIRTSRLAQAIARKAGLDHNTAVGCFTAGVLHDIGMLVLAAECPREFQQIQTVADEERISILQAEEKILECNHAEIGAYLLGIWGLPSEIVEAVAWHHFPSRCPSSTVSPLLAVHLADVFHTSVNASRSEDSGRLDAEYLTRCGVQSEVETWKMRCQDLIKG